MQPDEGTRAAYEAAWKRWTDQVEHLHRVLLEGQPIRPDQMKGLLNREARTKEAYDAARRRLLGIDTSLDEAIDPDENPFKAGA